MKYPILISYLIISAALVNSFAPQPQPQPQPQPHHHKYILPVLKNTGDNSIETLWLQENDDEDDDGGGDVKFKPPSPSSVASSPDSMFGSSDRDITSNSSKKAAPATTPTTESNNRKDKVVTIPIPLNQTVGVGRHGYNITTLHNVHYNIKLYFPVHEKIAYQIRLHLLRDYYKENGDINVPFRYNSQTFDYGIDKKKKDVYDIALGRWLHNLRKRYKADPEKIPEEFRKELDEMGMNWEGVGAGRRPSTFRKRCDELKAFVEENDHDRVPLDKQDNRSLGIWVERQRVLYRRFLEGGDCGEQLTDDRIEMLRDAGFDVETLVDKSWDGRFSARQKMFDEEWTRMYRQLKEYKDTHGHLLDVKIDLDSKESSPLLYWVAEQKHQHELVRNAFFSGARNLKTILTPDRFQKLSELGFGFALDSAISPWNDVGRYECDIAAMMNLLKGHCEESGQCDLTLDQVYSHQNIAEMLKLYAFQQRIRWEHRHRSIHFKVNVDWLLHREGFNVVEELNLLGFSWYDDSQRSTSTAALQDEYEWWEMYHDLLRYRGANGDFQLESDELWYSEELADWVEEQQMNYSKLSEASNFNEDEDQTISMSEWHYRALHSIGFNLNTDGALLPKSAGRKPSVWKLETNLENEIEDLPRDLQDLQVGGGKKIDKTEQLAWLVRYASLRRYYSKSGSGALSNISSDDISGQRLALWANNQRKQYSNLTSGKKSTMTKRRVDMLDGIGFDWKLQRPGRKEEWEEMKIELIEFKEKFGHCFVPAAYPQLGQWVLLQRQLYQQSRRSDAHGLVLPSTLSKNKEKDLLDIGLDLTMDNLSFGNMAYETMWMCRLEELAEFKDLHGHCIVPVDYKSHYYDLGLWVREQRILYFRHKQGNPSQLDKRRIDDLEQIGFSWDIATANETY